MYTPDVVITKQRFVRVSNGEEVTGIIPDKELGYYKSLMYLKEQGHDINKYIDLATVKLNVPRFFKPVMKYLVDFEAGDKVNLWTHQGYYPYEERTIKSIDFDKKEIIIAGDVWNQYEDELFDEFHFLASLEDNKDVNM